MSNCFSLKSTVVRIFSFGNKKENKRIDGETEGLPPSIFVKPGVIPVDACAISRESNINASFCLCVAIIRNNTSRGFRVFAFSP